MDNHRDDPIIQHCRSLPGATEDLKWGSNLVFSVAAKMFAVCDVEDPDAFSFKVEPVAFEMLTAQDGIEPAPYLARHHWVRVDGRHVLPEDVLKDLLTASHGLVASKLPKKKQRELGLLSVD